jgi:hypothetical protein
MTNYLGWRESAMKYAPRHWLFGYERSVDIAALEAIGSKH